MTYLQVNKVACREPFRVYSVEETKNMKTCQGRRLTGGDQENGTPYTREGTQDRIRRLQKEIADLKNDVGMTELKKEELFDNTKELSKKFVSVIDLTGIDEDDWTTKGYHVIIGY